MIINAIIHGFFATLKLIFGGLPDVPATPTAVSDAGTWITNQIHTFISVLRNIYGGTLLDAIVLVLVAIFVFKWVYVITMWIVKKIPVINLK